MAKFKIEFDTDTAAFESFPEIEIWRVLNRIEEFVEAGLAAPGDGEQKIFDVNGNNIGRWEWAS